MYILDNQTDLVVFNNGNILHHGVKPGWFASVRNTLAGRRWIESLKKANPQYKYRVIGRGKNRKKLYENAGRKPNSRYGAFGWVPLEIAERLCVYLYEKPPVGSRFERGDNVLL